MHQMTGGNDISLIYPWVNINSLSQDIWGWVDREEASKDHGDIGSPDTTAAARRKLSQGNKDLFCSNRGASAFYWRGQICHFLSHFCAVSSAVLCFPCQDFESLKRCLALPQMIISGHVLTLPMMKDRLCQITARHAMYAHYHHGAAGLHPADIFRDHFRMYHKYQYHSMYPFEMFSNVDPLDARQQYIIHHMLSIICLWHTKILNLYTYSNNMICRIAGLSIYLQNYTLTVIDLILDPCHCC